MGRNGPRTSSGASGLRSKVSRWLGPPHMNRRMHRLALPNPAPADVTSAEAGTDDKTLASEAAPPAARTDLRLTEAQRRNSEHPCESEVRRPVAINRGPFRHVVQSVHQFPLMRPWNASAKG